MLARAHRLESDERHLHASKRTDGIPCRVSDVKTARVATHDDEREGVDGDHVRNEGVSTYGNGQPAIFKYLSLRTPGGHHVEVEERGERAKECATKLEGLDPQIEGEHEQEDGNGLVIV